MSEFWKSTDRYWCKHCKLFVKDTKLERTNHDATPRHLGNLKRFVRDLHKSNDREAREKQRAKDEVARLNGYVSGAAGSSRSGSAYNHVSGASSTSRPAAKATHKEQLQQLSDLGVSLPDEFRKELSMTGEWQTVSETLIMPETDVKKDSGALGYGVRKRLNPEDEEEQEERDAKRKRWESSHKSHKMDGDDDLDALLRTGIGKRTPAVKTEEHDLGVNSTPQTKLADAVKEEADTGIPAFKKESSDSVYLPPAEPDAAVKEEEAVGVIFKKRAKKNIRQK